MTKKKSLELADLNLKVGIAYVLALIAFILLLILWKVLGG